MTGQLGIPQSQLGNIELGSPSPGGTTPASGLSLIQTVTCLKKYNRTVVSTLSQLSVAIAPNLHFPKFFGNAFGMSQHVRVWKVHARSLTSSYSPESHPIPGQVDIETANNTLTQTGTATRTKIKTLIASNVLTQSSSVTRKQKRNFSLTNQLTFLPNHVIYVPVGSLGNTVIPNLLVTKIATQQIVTSPFGQYPRRVPPFCILQVPQLAITLPAPEFNDSEALSGLFTIRRSMTGLTWTYVHRLNTSKLKYDFIIGVPKMLELENYLLNYNSSVHTLTNWKGEIWYVVITNNPMELVTKSRYSNGIGNAIDDREKVSVVLEFEGNRIH